MQTAIGVTRGLAAERRAKPRTWRLAGAERGTRILAEQPLLIIAFHSQFAPGGAGTRHVSAGPACSLASRCGWCPPPAVGRWLMLEEFPQRRRGRYSECWSSPSARVFMVSVDDEGRRPSRASHTRKARNSLRLKIYQVPAGPAWPRRSRCTESAPSPR